MEGKAMIVCMSRRICVDLYKEIVEAAPAAGTTRPTTRAMLKVVMTGSASDPVEWQPHIRNKPKREETRQAVQEPEGRVQDRHRA
jgi:type I restriction enzyme R subunit